MSDLKMVGKKEICAYRTKVANLLNLRGEYIAVHGTILRLSKGFKLLNFKL